MPPHTAPEFAYRLPTDVALRIQDTAPPLVTMGSSRTRLIVLILTFLTVAGGMTATLPVGDAAAMVKHECLYDPEEGSNSTNDPLLCN